MALYSLRLRRAFSLLSIRRPFSSISAFPAPLCFSSTTVTAAKPSLDLTQPHHNHHRLLHLPFQSRLFRSSTVSLSSRPRSSSYNRDNDDDKISPDAILFEGCDFNHWLITMDFPKDNKPTPEEMVETYVQTAAKVLGSVEEAKKKIYACSTTTYNGFQVEVSEEVSEKFRGLPGVVFILPDSYIDPVNKEYGGDKYINGTIIPRPPPVQYGRSGGRYGDRNRDFNRQNRPRGSYQQGNAAYDNQGSMHGDSRSFGAQQNPPQFSGPPRDFGAQQNPQPPQYSGPPRDFGAQQNPQPAQYSGPPRDFGAQQNPLPPPQYSGPPRDFGAQQNPLPPPQYSGPPRDFGAQQNPLPPPQYSGPPRAGERRDPMPVNNAPGGWDNFQRDRREPIPSYQANYNQGQRDFQPRDQRNYAPPQGGAYGQGAGGAYGQGVDGTQGQGAGGSYGQGAGGTYGQGAGGSYGQGAGGTYGQGAGGTYGQGAGGVQGQGAGGGYGQGVGGAHGQEMGSGYGQSDLGHGENQRFSQMEPRDNMQGQQRNYEVMGETETGQGRY